MSEEMQIPVALPAVGARAERVRTITDDDIVRFAEVSGDRNPVHLDAVTRHVPPLVNALLMASSPAL